MRAAALVALFLKAAFPAADEGTLDCGRLADVPRPSIVFEASASKVPLRRAYSLLELFSEGAGTFEPGEPGEPGSLDASPLPWRSAPGREGSLRLVTWHNPEAGNDESMTAFVLAPGASWCTPTLDLPAGARLRFEAFSEGGGRLEADGFDGVVPGPGSFASDRQTDLALAEGRKSLCFRASKAPVAIGEARVLVPETESVDTRPRWIVLTLVDALRADALDALPTLSALAASGARYENAIAPGCHTRASVWPILTGRDLMRVDPLQRRQSMPIQAPLESIYARGNLFIGNLAEAAGYHSVFLGNNAYLRSVPAFSRYSSWGRTDTGTADTMRRLPELLSRYGDERILLVYYVSTPHAQSETPRRLYDELRCSELRGLDECRCRYQARARHADEAIEALQTGLRAYGLDGKVLQIATADHGEAFGDGRQLEGEVQSFQTGERGGAFAAFDRGHGFACHPKEIQVPLVVHGPDAAPGRWTGPVSGLDIVPTLLDAMRLHPPGNLDGRPLPSTGSAPAASRVLVSHGFCSDSRIEDGEQLLWWLEGCRVRNTDGTPFGAGAELFRDGSPVFDRARLDTLLDRHEEWLLERLPFDSFVFGVDRLDSATVRVEVEGGRIVDFGPASSIYGVDKVEVLGLTGKETTLRVRFEGYRGLYRVATLPPRAPVKIEIEERPDVVAFVGPLQLPLPVAGRTVDPASDLSFFLAKSAPAARASSIPSLRFWWQRYERSESEAVRREMSDFDRVLREWGYIR